MNVNTSYAHTYVCMHTCKHTCMRAHMKGTRDTIRTRPAILAYTGIAQNQIIAVPVATVYTFALVDVSVAGFPLKPLGTLATEVSHEVGAVPSVGTYSLVDRTFINILFTVFTFGEYIDSCKCASRKYVNRQWKLSVSYNLLHWLVWSCSALL